MVFPALLIPASMVVMTTLVNINDVILCACNMTPVCHPAKRTD